MSNVYALNTILVASRHCMVSSMVLKQQLYHEYIFAIYSSHRIVFRAVVLCFFWPQPLQNPSVFVIQLRLSTSVVLVHDVFPCFKYAETTVATVLLPIPRVAAIVTAAPASLAPTTMHSSNSERSIITQF